MSDGRLFARVPWPTVAVVLASIAGVWSILSPLLGHMGPPWPCVFAGIVLLVAAFMMRVKPHQNVGWGLVVVVIGISIVLLGRGGIIPGIMAATGGVAAVVWRPRE